MVVISLAHVQDLGKLDRAIDIGGDVVVDGALELLADTRWAVFFALIGAGRFASLVCAIGSRGVETNKAAACLVDVVLGAGAA